MKDFLLFLFIGVLSSILFSSGQIENPDTHLRLTQTRIFLEDFKFKLPNDVGEESHGNIAINSNGERCMVYNPGQSILFIPFYSMSFLLTKDDTRSYYLTAFSISFINYIINAISAFFLFKIIISIGYSRRKSLFVALVFCFTSYSFVFAQSTYEHHFEMLLLLISIFLTITSHNKNRFILAGLAISIGLLFRSTTIIIIPSILLLIMNSKGRIHFLLGVLPGLIIVLLFNYYRFNNPLESGYSLAWPLAYGSEMNFWSLGQIPSAIVGLIFSPGKGLLFFSPTIIIGLFGLKLFYLKNKRFSIALLITILSYLIIFSMNFAWHGSIWSFGPRYILPLVPLLYLPIVELKIRPWIYSVLIIAFLAQVLLISVNYNRGVLEQYVICNGLDDDIYINSFSNTPYLIQGKNFSVILPKNIKGNLVNYQPNSPWKKEVYLGSNKDMLKDSIEINSINFWWIRIFHWKIKTLYRIASIFIIILALFFSIKYIIYVNRFS